MMLYTLFKLLLLQSQPCCVCPAPGYGRVKRLGKGCDLRLLLPQYNCPPPLLPQSKGDLNQALHSGQHFLSSPHVVARAGCSLDLILLWSPNLQNLHSTNGPHRSAKPDSRISSSSLHSNGPHPSPPSNPDNEETNNKT